MFLKCTNLSCGAWKFQEFTLNQKTSKTYFKHIFGPKMQPFKVKKEKDKAFNKIMLIIGVIFCFFPTAYAAYAAYGPTYAAYTRHMRAYAPRTRHMHLLTQHMHLRTRHMHRQKRI